MKHQILNSKVLFAVVAVSAIAIGLFAQSGWKAKAKAPQLIKGIMLPNTKPLVDVDFTDHNGQPFGSDKFNGKWSVLFFGFTNCPDVCPTTMQTMKQVKQKVADAGLWSKFQLIMVSVDPERDTTERLKQYVPYFDPEFIGLSAAVEQTAAFAKNLGILFFKSEATESGSYDVEHGAALILVNPNGQYSGVFSGPHKVDEISQDLIKIAKSGYQGASLNLTDNATGAPITTDTSVQANQTSSTASQPKSDLVFDKAWIRPAPPGATSMAAYFQLQNTSQEDIVISEVESSSFDSVMLHETIVENELTSMEHLENITIPAGQSLALAPMGKHLMLMMPKTALIEGDSAEIILLEQDGTRHSTVITVKQGE